MHRIFPTNSVMNKMKKKYSNICKYWEKVDNIGHYFFHCPLMVFGNMSQQEHTWMQKTKKDVKLDPKCVIWNNSNIQASHWNGINMINHYVLIGRSSITKLKNGNAHGLSQIFDSECELRHVWDVLTLSKKSGIIKIKN